MWVKRLDLDIFSFCHIMSLQVRVFLMIRFLYFSYGAFKSSIILLAAHKMLFRNADGDVMVKTRCYSVNLKCAICTFRNVCINDYFSNG